MMNGGKRSTLSILPIILCFLVLSPSSLFPAQENDHPAPGAHPALEIAFDYQRQSGIASNQFAVWIEDASGKTIETLYATRFTATGGWKRRPACLPEWVAAAKPDALSSQEVDGLTGATPVGGRLHCVWDGTDQSGNRVPPGAYRYVVEANLRWDHRAVYRGEIEVGGAAQTSRPQPEYFGDAGRERGMISNVVVRYDP